jgi:hypothetical protein
MILRMGQCICVMPPNPLKGELMCRYADVQMNFKCRDTRFCVSFWLCLFWIDLHGVRRKILRLYVA